jgi:hypothetical protein
MFRLLIHFDTQLIELSFVCAMPAKNMRTPRLFRTYSVEKYDSFDCAIWEAARATSAAPIFFKRIFIGIPPMDEPFVDAGLGCNNPVKQILMEAEHIFPHQHISCVISIGTGYVTTTGLPSPGLFNKVIPLDVVEVLKKITTECEATADEVEWRFRFIANVYFRFNVEQGLQNVMLAQWERLGEVKTHTEQYLRQGKVDKMVSAAIKALRERREVLAAAHLSAYNSEGTITHDGIGPVGQPSVKHRVPRNTCPPPTSRFTGRSDILMQLEGYFFPDQPSTAEVKQRIYVLYGLGGSGKTQIALKFIHKFYQWCASLSWYVMCGLTCFISVSGESIALMQAVYMLWSQALKTLQMKWGLARLPMKLFTGLPDSTKDGFSFWIMLMIQA